MKARAPSFEEQRVLLLKSKDEYEAGGRWNELYRSIDKSSSSEILKWLELQKLILTDWKPLYPYETMRHLAIQEFRLWNELEPFRPWLEECRQRKLFKDPFIVQNLEMALRRMDKKRSKNETGFKE